MKLDKIDDVKQFQPGKLFKFINTNASGYTHYIFQLNKNIIIPNNSILLCLSTAEELGPNSNEEESVTTMARIWFLFDGHNLGIVLFKQSHFDNLTFWLISDS